MGNLSQNSQMPPSPQKSKLSRRGLIQAALGTLLVGVSAFGVSLVLDDRDQTRTVAIATADSASGSSATEIPIEFVEIPAYAELLPSLRSDEWESLSTMVTNRSLRKGDIVSIRDFSLPQNHGLTGVTLELSIGEPAWLSPGQRVVLWVAPPASENSFSAPFVLSPNVLIESVIREEGFAAEGSLRHVDVLVSSRDVPGVVHALANRYFLYVVPQQ